MEYDYGYDLAGKFEPSVLRNFVTANKISRRVPKTVP